VAGAATGAAVLAGTLVGGLGRQVGQGPVDLLPDPAECDPEHSLPPGQQIHDLVATVLNGLL